MGGGGPRCGLGAEAYVHCVASTWTEGNKLRLCTSAVHWPPFSGQPGAGVEYFRRRVSLVQN